MVIDQDLVKNSAFAVEILILVSLPNLDMSLSLAGPVVFVCLFVCFNKDERMS